MQGPVMIMAGGTGGHIFPGLAVARELRTRGVPVVWLGARGGLETRLVAADGFEIDTIDIGGLRGKGFKILAKAPLTLIRALWQASKVIRRRRPRAVLSMGGFAAGPGGLMAWLLGRPLLVHEQNRVPGLTNKVLARIARRVLAGFPDAFPASFRAESVGNPVRADIAALAAPDSRFPQRNGLLRLLVLGGSQGARALNRVVPAAIVAAELGCEVRHQCGERFAEEASAAYAEAGIDASIEPFIRDMADAYAWADLVVCRAGALTIAELAAVGVGAILVPFPFAVDDHQTANARFLVEAGAARLLPESAQLADQLAGLLRELGQREQWLGMARAARACAVTDAAQRVADLCIKEGCA